MNGYRLMISEAMRVNSIPVGVSFVVKSGSSHFCEEHWFCNHSHIPGGKSNFQACGVLTQKGLTSSVRAMWNCFRPLPWPVHWGDLRNKVIRSDLCGRGYWWSQDCPGGRKGFGMARGSRRVTYGALYGSYGIPCIVVDVHVATARWPWLFKWPIQS